MKRSKIYILIGLLLLAASNSVVAQQTMGDYLKTGFGIERKNDSLVYLLIKIYPAKGLQVFSTHKQTADDAFVSAITLDSSLKAYTRAGDVITETGKLQKEQDATVEATLQFYTDSATFALPLHIPANVTTRIEGSFSWLGRSGEDFPSGEISFSERLSAAPPATAAATQATAATPERGAANIFWICFIAGLVMVFTPCVFPLIPVTVSFFLKKSGTKAQGIKNAVWYSLSIILIYTIPTFIITLIFGDTAMYRIATSAVANLLFFAIFILFAISFFGAFELELPSKWANKADAQAGKGGLIGIFFMALTLVIVSFSCTGPIVGTLLAQVSGSGAKMATVIGMLGLSAGLAIPFSLFAFFPSLLQSLPKSGGWLNSVKVVFGFVELALALKFLSNVDLIYGWHLLDREIFLVLWIVLTLMAGFYVLGKIKFSHDSDLKFVSVPRLFFAIAFFSFGFYLIPGLWGAPLKFFSGILPPITTQDFNLDALQYKIGNANTATANNSAAQPPKLYTDKLHMPLGLTAYFDFDEGIAAAKALHKPIMLDFTGHSCPNCRKMENQVWSNPEVLSRLKNDFVIISLYVDENADLPDNQVYTNSKGQQITTLAQKSQDYETGTFNMLSQPLYMFLDLQQKPLSDIKYGYDPDIQKFITHLDKVKAEFEKREGKQ